MTIAISIQKLILINYLEKNYEKIHSKIFCLLQKRRRNLNFIIMNLQKKTKYFFNLSFTKIYTTENLENINISNDKFAFFFSHNDLDNKNNTCEYFHILITINYQIR